MKVSFPFMGTPVGYKKLFELLGHDVIIPPKPTQRTIDLGVKYSPEFACFPLKVIMGSYIEAIEAGTEVIFTSGGNGPCRAGFYGETHQRILDNLGYDVKLIVLDQINRDYKDFISKLKFLKGKNSWLKLFRTAYFTYKVIKSLDKLEQEICRVRAYELNTGECTKTWEWINKEYDKIKDMADLRKAEKMAWERINSIQRREVPEREKIRVGIVGEIYVVMESAVNMQMEERLGNLGVEVRRGHYLSEWIEFNIVPHFISRPHELEILKKGEKYIEIIIGGHAKQTVGHIVDFKDQGFDGVIHLMPFGCLPELVTQSIIPKISEELDIPVLSLSLDEQTGLSNNLTRVEAFIDLIRNKKLKGYGLIKTA